MKYTIAKFIVCSFLFPVLSIGQIVTIEPTFFTIDDEITVTFDATQGNGGLEDVNQIYAHTGLITVASGPGNWQNVQGNWGTDDPKVKMTNIGENKHQLTYVPRDFYSVSAGTEVTQLSFVFRNVDGTREGKTANLADIFIDIPEVGEFSGFFQKPSSKFLVAEVGQLIEVEIVVSSPAAITLFDNNEEIVSVTNKTTLLENLPVTSTGDHIVAFTAVSGNDTISDSFSFAVNPEIEVEEVPEDIIPGWNVVSEESAILLLAAPQKEYVHVIGDFSNWKLSTDYLMKKSPDGTSFWIELEGLSSEDVYEYQYVIDGELIIADPLSKLVLDPNHDTFIDLERFGLDEYPMGFTQGVVSVVTTVEEDYNWTDDEFIAPKREDLVIYELLMRDFLGDRSYQSLLDTLSYLQSLGVNAIQLMPVQEYEGNNSWGYNPSYHGAIDKYYGTPDELRAVIDQAHELGMAVIMDVVYNHAFGQSPLVQMYWDRSQNRPTGDSPYFNPVAKHPFNVGYDFNHESPWTQTYVKQTLLRWIEDFHIDGFRFDLSKGFTQRQSSSNGTFSMYDKDRVDILQDYADFIWTYDEDSYVILEHFADNTEERELSNRGMMLWGNANVNFNEATMGYHENGKSDFGHIYAPRRGWENDYLIGYMESHDEERLMFKNLQFGNSNGSYTVKDQSTALDRVEMATAFFYSIPGPKMLWQFGELGYDFSINRCMDGSVSDDCRLSDKPVRWDYLNEPSRADLRDVASGMIRLRQTNPALNAGSYEPDVSGEVKRIVRSLNNETVVVIGNFDVIERQADPGFKSEGIWYDFINGDSIMVEDRTTPITLAPGEYHVYLSSRPDFTVKAEDLILQDVFLEVYPNPSSGQFTMLLQSEKLRDGTLTIYNMNGMRVYDKDISLSQTEKSLPITLEDSVSGMYLLLIQTTDGYLRRRFIIK